MPDMIVTRWWWIRHAPVVDAQFGRLSGQADVDADLSDLESFTRLGPELPNDALWIVSTLKRTEQTAEALCQAAYLNIEAVREASFSEQAFGDWTNKTWDEVGIGEDAQAFWNDPAGARPPGAPSESFEDLYCRVAPRIDQLTFEHGGRDIVCIAHAGSIRAAIALALNLTPEQALGIDVKNTALTRLDFISTEPKVLGLGRWRVIGLNQFGDPQ
ncbi:MAG: phosphoglycerate mutase [Rhodospirillaceae bacterium]|nr:MAG: phosphoglycerate mutase [Rhodospirillaceae bacterium]